MSRFHNPLPMKYQDSPVAGYYDMQEVLFYDSDIAKITIVTTMGFRTNFVTGRKLLFVRRIVTDSMNRPAVIHDEAYNSGIVPRKLADEIFYEAMLVDGVTKWRAWLAYRCVRLVGGKFYNAQEKSPA